MQAINYSTLQILLSDTLTIPFQALAKYADKYTGKLVAEQI